MIRTLKADTPDFEAAFARLAAREDPADGTDVVGAVTEILDAVATRKDAAVLEYTARFDARPGVQAKDLEVGPEALDAALASLDPEIRAALERARARIAAFHQAQRPGLVPAVLEDEDGTRATLRVIPLERVGVYVPGGTAAYPSTVLMNVIPAKVAGVPEVIMVTPAKGGAAPLAVLAAARLAGADRVFGIGGAQAIGALAFGTETIPRVNKIVGPGNAYVAEAKRQVFGRVAIDQVAGPSEVLILADETASPRVVALDLLAQAEHDTRSAAVLVTWSEAVAREVERELAVQVATLPRAEIAKKALAARGALVVARDREHAVALANRYAPEHLGLAFEGAEASVPQIVAAGAVFVGHHAPEALGDYNAGTNHVLPTSGTARFASPLSVHDFVRRMSVLEVDPEALEVLGPDATLLARTEGLEAHARAIEARRTRH